MKKNKKRKSLMPPEADRFFKTLKQCQTNFFNISLLEHFCLDCWLFEKQQDACFQALSDYCKKLPIREQMKAIPRLVSSSKSFPRLVLLAYDLFKDLDVTQKEQLTIPAIFWTMDDRYSQITKEEYDYRQRHGLICNVDGKFTRPSCLLDLQCFEKDVQMCIESKSQALFYLPGWKD